MLIPLTNAPGKFAVIDDADYPKVAGYKWKYEKYKSGNEYAIAHVPLGYASRKLGIKRKKHKVKMHRLLLSVAPGLTVDHRDSDGLNNRQNNLRPATKAQQLMNRRHNRVALSRYKGVTREQRSVAKPWRAQISVNRQNHRLGSYATEEEAALAYNQAAIRYFGEFARINEGL